MNVIKKVFVRRFSFFLLTLIMCFCCFINYIKNNLYEKFFDYGEYQCSNIVYGVLNFVVGEQLGGIKLENSFVETAGSTITIDYNVEMLNSIVKNVVNRTLNILHKLEVGNLDEETFYSLNEGETVIKEYLLYYVSLGMVLDNFFLGNLGVKLPVKYQTVGKLKGEVVSTIQEYGINNALIEIKLSISGKTRVLLPLKTKEVDIELSAPLVVKIIQGKVPDYYFGSDIVGGVN